MLGSIEIAISFKQGRGVVLQIDNGITIPARVDAFWARKRR
jgi:hypothetical protein